jgi:hypothetical protein
MPHRIRAIDLAHDRRLVLTRTPQTASSGDVERESEIIPMPPRIVQSISPTIGVSCSPGPRKLRHRGDVERESEIISMPHRIVQSISPTIEISCSPRPCKLRHREDVEQGPASTSTLLMT